jgi:TonB-dependent SusC/RagA subfamily outer membrane receptor
MKKNHAYRWSFTNPPLTKLLKIMKLTAILLTVCFMSASAGGFSQDVKVNLSLKDVKLTRFFKAIEKETKYRFAFSNDIIPEGRIVTINVKETPVSQVLNEVLSTTNLKYRFVEESGIFIISEKSKSPFGDIETIPQRTITGKVTSDKGEPLSGVSLQVKGTSKAAVTIDNGTFSIEVEDNAKILVFSFVGMDTKEVNIEGKTTIEVVLQLSNRSLNEVVVVGYGTQKRTLITGAVSSVNSKTLNEVPVLSISQALQGRVAGLTVTNNGSPGTEPIVRIRGISSISYASDPLYVVDGFPTGNLSTIDVRDIETVDVLKDASAAAIYGSRATNGVIMVTTKKGRRDSKMRVTLDSYYGTQEITQRLDLLNTEQFKQYALAYRNTATPPGGQVPRLLPPEIDKPIYPGATQTYGQTNTDWQDAYFKSGFMTQHNIGLSGGNDISRFYASAGYLDRRVLPQVLDIPVIISVLTQIMSLVKYSPLVKIYIFLQVSSHMMQMKPNPERTS